MSNARRREYDTKYRASVIRGLCLRGYGCNTILKVWTMNGWKNYETWNVILWVANDERLYRIASDCRSFAEFRRLLNGIDITHPVARETPDGVLWDDPNLDLAAIGEWWNDTFPMPCRKLASDITEFGIPKGGF